jgi:hypothetical protein
MRNRLLKSFALFALLAAVFASYADNNDNGDVVDLGLPSGVKWATSNVGAANPWDYGDYYAWGETQTKDFFRWETYKYCNGMDTILSKYCNDAEYGSGGFTDTLTTLEAADDVATAVLGSDYSMPTIADWYELGRQCYWVWTENYKNHNVSGYLVYKAKSAADKGAKVFSDGKPSRSYSLKDAHIFLPAAGSRCTSDLGGSGSNGDYWSASLNEDGPSNARYCGFNGNRVNPSFSGNRCYGLPVRPVRRK